MLRNYICFSKGQYEIRLHPPWNIPTEHFSQDCRPEWNFRDFCETRKIGLRAVDSIASNYLQTQRL